MKGFTPLFFISRRRIVKGNKKRRAQTHTHRHTQEKDARLSTAIFLFHWHRQLARRYRHQISLPCASATRARQSQDKTKTRERDQGKYLSPPSTQTFLPRFTVFPRVHLHLTGLLEPRFLALVSEQKAVQPVALLSVRYRDPDNDTLKNKIDVAIEWSMKGTATVEPLCPRVRRFCASIEEKRCSMRSVAAVDYTSAGPMICRHQVMQHARLWQKKLWKPSNNSVTFGAEDTPERLPSYSYSDFFPFYFGFLPNSPNSSLKNLKKNIQIKYFLFP